MSAKKRKNNTLNDLNLAIEAVKSGSLTTSAAAKQFTTPVQTIYDNVNGKSKSNILGSSTILSKTDEDSIAKYLISSAERGFPITRIDLLNIADKMMKADDENA
jgi:hypothetical protein